MKMTVNRHLLLCSTIIAIVINHVDSLPPPPPPWSSSSSSSVGIGRTAHPILGIVAGRTTTNSPFARRIIGSRLKLSSRDEGTDANIISKADETTTSNELDVDGAISSWSRLVSSLPGYAGRWRRISPTTDGLDRRIMSVALPSMLNLMVVPLVNAVDTLYVGRLADPLALAAQSAANQCFFSIYFMAAFLPTITAPLVAGAIGRKDWNEARDRVCEGLFLSNVLGGFFTLLLVGFPRAVLSLVLPPEASSGVMNYAVPYLRLRALGMVPALFASTGFAAYRGLLNTVTPLKVSLTTNLMNLALDPLFIFGMGSGGVGGAVSSSSFLSNGLGPSGAAAATSVAELASAVIYLRLLVRRRLIQWSRLFRPPSLKSLLPLIKGGLAMLLRQLTLNVAFVSAARRAQSLDPSGISAAAYGITMQIYSLGVVCHLGIQGTAAALVPSARAAGGDDAAREVADRIFVWGTYLGILLACVQWFALPAITPLFTPLAEVRDAVRGPAAISSFIHLVNGLVFAGEGTMLGLGSFRDLALVTSLGVAVMVSCLASPLGSTLNGVLLSLAAFNLVQGLAVTLHHVRISPLRRRGFFKSRNAVG
jgi:putative MATE family efflux protein